MTDLTDDDKAVLRHLILTYPLSGQAQAVRADLALLDALLAKLAPPAPEPANGVPVDTPNTGV